MKRIFFMMLVMLLNGAVIFAQQMEIHGSVVNDLGKRLENIIVKIDDSNDFTQTDNNGHFMILAKSGSAATLIHMMYKTKAVILEDAIRVVMQEQAFNLDNIIVKADPFRDLAQSSIVYDDIKAASQPRNVSDLFKDIPGFGIQKRGAYASFHGKVWSELWRYCKFGHEECYA
jgi:iron complex outermembrane receptor protein